MLPAALLAAAWTFSSPAAANGAKFTRPNVPCTCRYQGEDFALGASACLNLPQGPRMARCDRVLNNTSWTFIDAPCPIAEGPADTGRDVAPTPGSRPLGTETAEAR